MLRWNISVRPRRGANVIRSMFAFALMVERIGYAVQPTLLKRACVLAFFVAICACSHSATNGIPPWLELRTGAQARLRYSLDYDPEQTTLYPSASAARSSVAHISVNADIRQVASGTVVSIESIDPNEVNRKHVVDIVGDNFSGWVIAEDSLLPVPPIGTQLMIPETINHVPQQLYTAQDDDDSSDGAPLGATSRITYEAFDLDPGNPEYLVRVEDGPLAGQTGYVVADEIESPQTGAFRLVEP